jgi:hypothetical protein
MAAIEIGEVRELVESAVTAISILGGAMAYCSGYFAAQALAAHSAPDTVAQRVNEGIGQGFVMGSPLAVVALIIEAWT